MKTAINIIIISLLLFSCNGNQSNTINNKDSVVVQPTTEVKKISKTKNVLLANIKPHFFSDSVKKDTFKLILSGDSLTSSRAIFSIISFKGKQIYCDSAQGRDIGEEYLDANAIRKATYSQWINAIRHRTASFFEDSNFVNALRVPTDGGCGEHPELTDSVNWVEVHTYKKAIGFHYFYWGVDDFYITWSKKQQKAVTYWHNDD